MDKDTIRYCFEVKEVNRYINLAKIKYYEARNNPHYKAYQLDNARWRISYDVFKEILRDVVSSYPYMDNCKTLMGFPVDICEGEGILKLYVEV